ncbi:MAG: PilZ domain-containing protein [Nitrospinota bacterium]
MNQNLREYQRIPSDIKVLIKEPDLKSENTNDFFASICNISEGGVYISHPEFPIFSILNFVILPDSTGAGPISASGIVQFNDGAGIGVKFIRIDKKASERLRKIIQKHS